MADYKYPRVTISTTAKVRSRGNPAAADTTVLFAPLITIKGPTEVTAVHSLSEFVKIFGDLSYKTSGQTALNIYNWLSAGGTLYVKRLINTTTDTKTKFGYGIEAKYYGAYYNSLEILITGSSLVIQRRVSSTKVEILEKMYRLSEKNIESAISNSEYIAVGSGFNAATFVGLGYITDPQTGAKSVTTTELTVSATSNVGTMGIESYTNILAKDSADNKYILEKYWGSEAAKDLGNPLETPIDIIMDAAYPEDIKVAMAGFICNGTVNGRTLEGGRKDIVGIFDLMSTGDDVNNKLTPLEERTGSNDIAITDCVGTNIAIYDQYFTVEDATFTDQNIFVGPTYFLSKLLPYNDSTYGMQFATAGLRRGILSDALAVNENPDADKKNTDFIARINYVEKSTREYAFMSQRTHDGSTDEEYTSLSFLNNVRVLEKMKKELERLGREYLFEFNDSVTLSQLSNVLNKYITEWISNRTLSYALVEVSRNPYNDEAVDIRLNIKFNRTIELISVDITID